MADITVYKPANLTVQVLDGDPPADQSALVAQLQAQVAQLTTDLATMTSDRDAQKARADAAEAKLVTIKSHADAIETVLG